MRDAIAIKVVYIPPQGFMLVNFCEVPNNDDFISPEGSWCRKVSPAVAIMMDPEDTAHKVGEQVVFMAYEKVEYTPRRPEPRVAFPGYISHLMERQHA